MKYCVCSAFLYIRTRYILHLKQYVVQKNIQKLVWPWSTWWISAHFTNCSVCSPTSSPGLLDISFAFAEKWDGILKASWQWLFRSKYRYTCMWFQPRLHYNPWIHVDIFIPSRYFITAQHKYNPYQCVAFLPADHEKIRYNSGKKSHEKSVFACTFF